MADLTTLANVKAWLGLKGKPITAITRANPGVVSCAGHGLITNDLASFSGILGMTQLNGQTVTVTVIDANSFSVGLDTTGYSAYVSGGFVGPDDATLARLITGLSASIESILSRHFAQASYAETRNGHGKTEMMVLNYPIISVASIAVDGVAIPPRTSPTGSGFVFDEDTIYLAGYSFTRGVQNVQIGYSAGFAAIPNDLDQAMGEAVAFAYKERGRIGMASEVLAGQQVSYLRDLPPHLVRRFNQYQRVVSPV